MAFVNMKCKSCGATLRACEGYAVCDYCGSVYFRMNSAAVPEGIQTASLTEFLDAVDKYSDTYSVICSEGVLSDVDADLTKSKLKAAEEALKKGEAYKVDDCLKGLPDSVFPAARLRLLASTGAKNEAELCFYAGDLNALPHFKNVLACCGDENKETYTLIAKKCLENAGIVKQIQKGHEFLRIGQSEDGLKYAENVVARYPFYARAWELLIKARCLTDKNYSPEEDLKRFNACPDASVTISGGEKDVYGAPTGIDRAIAERMRSIALKRNSKAEFFYKYVLKPLLVLIAVGLLIGAWKLISLFI